MICHSRQKIHILKHFPEDENCMYRSFLSGGVNPKDPTNDEDNRDHVVMAFFRDSLAPLLNIAFVKGG